MKELDIEQAVKNLRESGRLISENRVAVVVYRDELDLVLNRLAELEKKVAELPDTDSELVVGDEVVTLINYRNSPKESIGVVEKILTDGEEYPYRIRFTGEKYAIGYNREELGKVKQ